MCFNSLLGSKPHLVAHRIHHVQFIFEGSPTPRHTQVASLIPKHSWKDQQKTVTSPWSYGGSCVPSDVRIGATDGVAGKGSHVYFIS